MFAMHTASIDVLISEGSWHTDSMKDILQGSCKPHKLIHHLHTAYYSGCALIVDLQFLHRLQYANQRLNGVAVYHTLVLMSLTSGEPIMVKDSARWNENGFSVWFLKLFEHKHGTVILTSRGSRFFEVRSLVKAVRWRASRDCARKRPLGATLLSYCNSVSGRYELPSNCQVVYVKF